MLPNREIHLLAKRAPSTCRGSRGEEPFLLLFVLQPHRPAF